MTIPAAQPLMRTGQRKMGLGCVVELPIAPTVRVVAGNALFAQVLLVHVLGTVTTDAFVGRLAECPRRMAFLAGNADMQADQRKTGEVMVELHLVSPASLVVAMLAVAAERTLVHVVNGMAAGAFLRQLLLLEDARVAGMAIERCMCATKGKLCALLVIE